MKAFRLLFCFSLVALPACSPGQEKSTVASEVEEPAPVASPVEDVVYVRPFTLAEGYQYDWSLERQMVTSGTLVVFKVDPELVVPTDAAQRVLYVGDQAVQRLNHGHESGHVIAIIPGDTNLTREPTWFGSAGLPERTNAESNSAERAVALRAKIEPFGAEKIDGLTQSPLQAENLPALLREHVADLVLEYSPEERHLAESWRLPVAGVDSE